MSRRDWKLWAVDSLTGVSGVVLLYTLSKNVSLGVGASSLAAISREVHTASVPWEPAVRVIGTPPTPLRLTVFVDYTCPHSRAMLRDLLQLQVSHPTKIAVDIRDFPLDDSAAREAALAVRCATALGYDSAINAMLLDEEVISAQALRDVVATGSAVRVNTKMGDCITDTATHRSLAAEIRAAYLLGVDRVPSVLVGDRLIAGRPSSAFLASLLTR